MLLKPGLSLAGPRPQPIYELWRESAKLQLLERQPITEFEFCSAGADRTQRFANLWERRLTGPRSRAKKRRAHRGRRHRATSIWRWKMTKTVRSVLD